MAKTIEAQWNEFRGLCFQKDLPPTVEADLRKCFYAGAFVAFQTLTNVSVAEPEHIAVKRVQALQVELVSVLQQIHNVNKQRN